MTAMKYKYFLSGLTNNFLRQLCPADSQREISNIIAIRDELFIYLKNIKVFKTKISFSSNGYN
jgi:hypothetical protein